MDRLSMSNSSDPVRVLYSFPHKLGASRICYTAWQQVNGLAAAGAEILAMPGALSKPVAEEVRVQPTLARGALRLPYKVLGSARTLALHDAIVARRLRTLASRVDIVHTWPMGALRTLKVARQLGVPTVLERPNANTRFAYEAVDRECQRLGVALPPGHEHAYNADILRIEEEEYQLADGLLCPSDFVVKTFLDHGFEARQLVRHSYGFDEKTYYPDLCPRPANQGLATLFVGVCAVRKGVHFALEAWLSSPACENGTFQIAGEFLPAYLEKLRPMLSHPSVKVLGHRNDVPELMRASDVLILPSIEEGFGLVIADAIGSGCVPLASDACTEICRHMETGLVHPVGDVKTLAGHISMLHCDRGLLQRLRASGLSGAGLLTWTAAGVTLLRAYRQVIAARNERRPVPPAAEEFGQIGVRFG
ncbi:MAG: glycosyltransferase family 4 protein [Terriglobia bacterium]